MAESFFREHMHFGIDKKKNYDPQLQAIVDELLKANHSVGIIAGYCDKNYPISVLSDKALELLEFDTKEEFFEKTGGYAAAVFEIKELSALLYEYDDSETRKKWLRVRDKKGNMTWFEAIVRNYTDRSGMRMWCMSFKNVTRMQRHTELNMRLINALGIAYDEVYIVNLDSDQYIYLGHRDVLKNSNGLFSQGIEARLRGNYVHPDSVEIYKKYFSFSDMQARLNENPEVKFRYRRRVGDNRYEWYSANIIACDMYAGEVIAAILCIRNVEDEVVKEQKRNMDIQYLLQSTYDVARRANETKTIFLAHMSHDIRTPLNGILGMCNIARKNIDDKERLIDALGKIELEQQQLYSLISDVLDMSKLESGKELLLENVFDIRGTIKKCGRLLRPLLRDREIELKLDFRSLFNPIVSGSAPHIERVIGNLLRNAIIYNNPGGRVVITCKSTKPEAGMCEYIFEIEDNGIGMSSSYIKHIYEPFSQEKNDARTEYPGAGLGMSIVKKLVELMYGSIDIESSKNVGTKVTIGLHLKVADGPCVIDTATESVLEGYDDEIDVDSLSFEGRRALLVEDNYINLEIARYMLETELGFKVDVASDGKEAVKLVTESEPFTYDIVFMDIMLPVMDGYRATRLIRSCEIPEIADIPIVAMTANAFPEDIMCAREAGMTAHLAKPIEMYDLAEVLVGLFGIEESE